MPWKKQDLTGKRFGKLTAIESVRKNHYGWIWKCKCDCGNFVEITTAYLNRGSNKSCGCNLHGENHYMWSGHKGLSGYFWRRVLQRAKDRNLEVNLTVEDAWELLVKQEFKCALTGVPLTTARNTKGLLSKEQTASLDRINSTKGYILENVQWVHKDVNIMKFDMTVNDLIYWSRKIVDFNKNTLVEEPTSNRIRWDHRNENKSKTIEN